MASHDPLYGEKVPDKPYGVTGPTPPPQNRAGMSPPQPQTTAAKSTAALLIPDPPPAGKQLAITDTAQQNPPTGNWQPKDPLTGSVTASGGGPPVMLKTPEQAPLQPVPPTTLPGVVPGQASNLQAVPVFSQASYSETDDLKKALDAHNVIWQDQQPVNGGIHFSCRVANPLNATQVRLYEATAVDYPSAVRAVLEQIDAGH